MEAKKRDYLEDTLNLASCAYQTNLRTELPETEYTRKRLEARRSPGPKPGSFLPGLAADPRLLPRIRGLLVEPRVDFRRVASSRLLEASLAYIYPCIRPKRKQSSFLGVGSDSRRRLV